MRSLWKMLLLCMLVFSPCVIGCSSQMSEEDAERLEADEEGSDPGELDDDGSEDE